MEIAAFVIETKATPTDLESSNYNLCSALNSDFEIIYYNKRKLKMK